MLGKQHIRALVLTLCFPTQVISMQIGKGEGACALTINSWFSVLVFTVNKSLILTLERVA